MLSIAIYDESEDRRPNLADMLESAIRKNRLPISAMARMDPRRPIRDGDGLISNDVFLFSVAVAKDAMLDFAKRIRSLKSDAYIVFVTGATKGNIQRLVRPSVGLSGLLFVPPEESALCQTINEIAAERAAAGGTGEVFTVKSGSEYRKIPLRNIVFFQSQEKKIVLATDKQEIEFYSSLSAIIGQVPDYFARCYKSFIVNTRFIAAVDVSLMEITLSNGFRVPLSRQYKGDFRKFVQGGDQVG